MEKAMTQPREVPSDLKAVFENIPELLPRVMQADGYPFRRRLLAEASASIGLHMDEDRLDTYALLLTYRANMLSDAELERLNAGISDAQVVIAPITPETLFDGLPDNIFPLPDGV
jgi:hypothetical protein